jgi:uncharacterized protein (TIGR00730 family)
MAIQSICIYCGSRPGNNPAYVTAAAHIGQLFAQRGITLLFGGGNVGLMGTVANNCLDNGGKVIGVIPSFMDDKELGLERCSELLWVGSMHERKNKLAELSEAFIALPGGPGTMDEFFEMFTWLQLQLHHKPVALFNINGYYNGLLAFMQHMVNEGFLKQAHFDQIIVSDNIESLLEQLNAYEAVGEGKR